jgi:hypothetical protein
LKVLEAPGSSISRQKVPDVTLPYFDSTMDEAMVDPTQSIIFSPQFLGNGNGLVTNGPFAYWQTPSGPLIRNIGNPGGSLFSKDEIRMFLSRTRNAEILEPGASNTFNLERRMGHLLPDHYHYREIVEKI